MMRCPKCQRAAQALSSRYLSTNTKERYHQCQNINFRIVSKPAFGTKQSDIGIRHSNCLILETSHMA